MTCTRSRRPAFTFALSQPARVAVRLCECNELGEDRSIRVIHAAGVRGANRVAIPRRMLAAMRRGRYIAALLAENAAGNDAARVRPLVLTLAGRP